MTAKRFKHLRFVLDVDKTGNLRLFDLDDKNKTYDKLDDVVDLLNEVSEENEQLKYNYNEKCNEYCGLEEQVDILLKENEKLKSDVYDWKASAEDYLKLGKSLKKENEQLKAINKYLIELLEYNGATVEIEQIKGDME